MLAAGAWNQKLTDALDRLAQPERQVLAWFQPERPDLFQPASFPVWNLREVFRQFPKDDPLREQCTGWMHAVVGKHFFPDANHRTAVALLRRLLRQNDIRYQEWSLSRLAEARR